MQTPSWLDGELIAFDLETTGVDPFSDVPVAYALLRFEKGELVERHIGLVNPGRPIPPEATRVHHITDEDAAKGRDLATVIAEIADTLIAASKRGTPIVGFKVDYDLTMIDAQHRLLRGVGLADAGFSGPVLDPLVIDRHFVEMRRGKRRLVDLCAHYEIGYETAHDAASDAKAAFDLLVVQCREFKELAKLEKEALHRFQGEWHRHWVKGFSKWLVSKDLTPLGPENEEWPITKAPTKVQKTA
jgi:DNA polymerase-3 subunit epsilon